MFRVEEVDNVVGNIFYVKGKVRRFPGTLPIDSCSFLRQVEIAANVRRPVVNEIYIVVA